MQPFYFILSVFVSLKILGGGLSPLLIPLGLSRYHGPIGGCLCVVILAFCFSRVLRSPVNLEWRRVNTLDWLVIAVVIGWHAFEISRTPIHIEQSDMIPMVQAGLRDFVQFKNPYHPRILEGGRIQPGFYIPGIWLPYLPSFLLDWDIRWTNLISSIVFLIVLFDRAPRRSIPLYLLVLCIGFSKVFRTQPASSHLVLLEAAYPLTVWAVLRLRKTLAIWLIALLINSREIAFILVLPYLVSLWCEQRKYFYQMAITVFVFTLCLNFPFWIGSNHHFWDQIKEYQRTFVETPVGLMLAHWGILGVLKEFGIHGFGKILQIAGVVAGATLVYRFRLSATASLAIGALSWLWVIVLMPTTWAYLFIQPIQLCALVAVVSKCFFPTKRATSV